MSEFILGADLGGNTVRGVAAPAGGRFAVLTATPAGTGWSVSLFERAGDGSVRKVGRAIALPEPTFAAPEPVARPGGGLAVATSSPDTGMAAGFRTEIGTFAADGRAGRIEAFDGLLPIASANPDGRILEVARDPLRPAIWGLIDTGFGGADRTLPDPDRLLPRPLAPTARIPGRDALVFDGGFGLTLGFARGDTPGVSDVNAGGPLPTFDDPSLSPRPGQTFRTCVAAGNALVEVPVFVRSEEVGPFRLVGFERPQLVLAFPDGTRRVEVLTEEFRAVGLRPAAVEIPGVGFAA